MSKPYLLVNLCSDMAECMECHNEFHRTVECSVCGDVYCLSHRRPSEHNCVSTMKPNIRSLSADNWSWISYAVNRLLFFLLLISLVLFLVEFLL